MNQRLTLQLIMSLPPNPHPIEVFRCALNTVAGVDGCKGGWFYFCKDQASISFGIAASLEDLLNHLPPNSRVFIDIPIGLLDEGGEGRDCDKIARKALGSPRASSVFPAPAHPVLCADNYEDAKKRSFEATGKKISQQTFAMIPKIREVNNYLAANRDSGCLVREIHPEVCFWGLNSRQAMKHPKKNPSGFEERRHVLEKFLPNIHAIIEGPLQKYARYVVAKDDILDALVGLVVASTSDEKLKTMPPKPKLDSRGLPMEKVYTEEPNDHAL